MKKIILAVLLLCSVAAGWAQEQVQEKERALQLSFVTPLGTNGFDSHLYTNSASFNLLGGYSYANTAFEFGGLYNINLGYTQGVQFAGLFNYTGESRKAVQFAGLTNIALAGEATVQMAPIANIAENVNGLQMSSILNIAKKVEGVQFGLINYAEEIDGVPIGLISIVKNGGKREFEVSFSEALNTTLSFKLGVDRFYTIFSAGTRYIGRDFEFAPGIGFGTQLNWAHGWSNQIEVLAYQLTEDTEFVSDLNMLTQLKLVTSKTLVKGLNVFAGPTWNMTISQYKDKDGKLGSSLSPWSMWKNDSDTTRLNMWIGFTAGVSYRF